MGFLYEALNKPGMSRKHFAIAKVKRMRDLGQLQPKNNEPKNFRTVAIDYFVEIIDYKNVDTMDQNMKPVDSDKMFFDLIGVLINNYLYTAANIALKKINDQHSNDYLMNKAKIRIMQGNFEYSGPSSGKATPIEAEDNVEPKSRFLEATDALDEILAKNPDNYEAHVMRGHAFFLHGNLFDSEESYINALRLKPAVKD